MLSVCSHFYFILLFVIYYFILFIEFIMAFPRKGPLSPSCSWNYFSKFLHKKMIVLDIEQAPSGTHYRVLDADFLDGNGH